MTHELMLFRFGEVLDKDFKDRLEAEVDSAVSSWDIACINFTIGTSSFLCATLARGPETALLLGYRDVSDA